MNELMHVMQP